MQRGGLPRSDWLARTRSAGVNVPVRNDSYLRSWLFLRGSTYELHVLWKVPPGHDNSVDREGSCQTTQPQQSLMPTLDGHKSATSEVLLDLLTGAHTGRTRFSLAQRAFFTVCEFWAAAQNRSLLSHLGDAVESGLQAAETSFSVIGLPNTASLLTRARIQLSLDSPIAVERVLAQLENALSAVDEPVDDAIERFAKRELSAK
jgi:hypothetical protein